MYRLLFISTSIPPVQDSQTIVNMYLIKGLIEANFEIYIVTPRSEGILDPFFEQITPNIKIHRTRLVFYDNLKKQLNSLNWENGKRILKSALASVCGKILIPDVYKGWDKIVCETINNGIVGNNIDIIISASGSYTAHMAASKLSNLLGEIPWLAFYGDPWSINPLATIKTAYLRKKIELLERNTLNNCTGIIVTTENAANKYKEWLDNKTTKVYYLPCGFPEDILTLNHGLQKSSNIVMSYIGTARRSSRDLRIFINSLSKVINSSADMGCKIIFNIVGDYSTSFEREAKKLKMANSVIFTSWVSYKESLNILAKSDILLLFGNRGNLQIPAKTYVYLGSGKPILYYGQMPLKDDPTWQLIYKYPGVINITQPGVSTSSILEKVIINYDKLLADSKKRIGMKDIKQYGWHFIAKIFAEIVLKTIKIV